MTVEEVPRMEAVEYFRETLKAARYGTYDTILSDGNALPWKHAHHQLLQLNTIMSTWTSSVLPLLSALPPELIASLQSFFSHWTKQLAQFGNSSILGGYYACECMILLAQGPVGRIRELSSLLLIPLARQLTEHTWRCVVDEQRFFSFPSLPLPPPNKRGMGESNFLAQDLLLLIDNARQVGENLKLTLEELFATPE